jgi:hypothetical protein
VITLPLPPNISKVQLDLSSSEESWAEFIYTVNSTKSTFCFKYKIKHPFNVSLVNTKMRKNLNDGNLSL